MVRLLLAVVCCRQCIRCGVCNVLNVCADWTEQQEDAQNAALWEVDWDDDGLDDEFSRSLREQLSKPLPKQGAS